MKGAETVDLRAKSAEMGEVADPDRPPPDLVLIGRADAAAGRADLAGAAGVLAQRVEVAVEGEDERAGVGDLEVVRCHGHALLAEPLDLGPERPGVEHDPVADHREGASDDSRREQGKLVGLFADDERVAGIVPALEAGDDIGPARQPVDDLALPLVAPLDADDGDVGHAMLLLMTVEALGRGRGEVHTSSSPSRSDGHGGGANGAVSPSTALRAVPLPVSARIERRASSFSSHAVTSAPLATSASTVARPERASPSTA